MSRTNKDKPWWVVCPWYEPCHSHCDQQSPPRWGAWQPTWYLCDLPPDPVRICNSAGWWNGYVSRLHTSADTHCYWSASWDGYTGPRYHTRQRVSENLVWWSADRARSRDECRDAVKEHRSCGEVLAVQTVRSHRHQCGWWD